MRRPSLQTVVFVVSVTHKLLVVRTVFPRQNSMMPAMYWQMPPKNIIVVIMMLGASTPRVPRPVKEIRKTLVAKESRPSGAGFARRR